MPANPDFMSLDFMPFHIFSAHGQQYCGVQPSMIPKPFKSAIVVLGGRSYKPGLPDGCSSKETLGYDAALRVGVDAGKGSAYRLITLMKDGSKWSKLIYSDGSIEEDWF